MHIDLCVTRERQAGHVCGAVMLSCLRGTLFSWMPALQSMAPQSDLRMLFLGIYSFYFSMRVAGKVCLLSWPGIALETVETVALVCVRLHGQRCRQ